MFLGFSSKRDFFFHFLGLCFRGMGNPTKKPNLGINIQGGGEESFEEGRDGEAIFVLESYSVALHMLHF